MIIRCFESYLMLWALSDNLSLPGALSLLVFYFHLMRFLLVINFHLMPGTLLVYSLLVDLIQRIGILCDFIMSSVGFLLVRPSLLIFYFLVHRIFSLSPSPFFNLQNLLIFFKTFLFSINLTIFIINLDLVKWLLKLHFLFLIKC